ncbi:hypothetical protein ABVK25_001598 [Lepraria finkii]|uniref:Uncharacterized protein n=1 Tax=Lepraria finkii TaxID=1340010 RepID=A0ABR4BLS0_9LECA
MPLSVPSPSPSPTPGSGIVSTPTGDRHIPPSTRADGSLPQRNQNPPRLPTTRGRRSTRGSGGVPGAEGLKSGGSGEEKSSAGKNAKRREARKRAKAAERDGGEEEEEQVNGYSDVGSKSQSIAKSKAAEKDYWRANALPAKEPEPELDPEAEKEKLARNLKKKLRQARELREKKDKGRTYYLSSSRRLLRLRN